ncbi:MAG: methylated-DNA--[protein]-cysteine S-methyltransferase [Clostridiales bacterium]|nr:methylated-DNA--[protein]-cysteine S-methyltransferase [Clostridiales bacterium]
MADIRLSPIRILDSAKIRDQRILDPVTDDVPSFIRSVLADTNRKYFTASFVSDGKEQLFGVLGLENYSEKNRSADAVMYFPESSLSDEAPIKTEDDRKAAFDSLLRYAFFDQQIHRISVLIPVTDETSEKILLACHMKQEAVLDEALYVHGAYCDGALFSLLDSEYPDYSVGFVPFRKGVVAIRGDNEVIEMTRFFSYGKPVEGNLERNVAIRTGIADNLGILKEEGSPEYKDLFDMEFPKEVMRCMTELNEYFMKRRTAFTIHAKPLHGSDFQKKVWDQVSTIPYGVTRSYEDIALDLTGGDKVSARNLTRAVGAACGDNPLPILVPCHRIIGKDGRLVGFSGGLEIKEFLLNHEMFGIHLA